MQSIWLIIQLLIVLFVGFSIAHKVPHQLKTFAFKILPYFSYILLIAIAIEFSQVLHHINRPLQIVSNALTLSVATSVGTFLCCYFVFKKIGYQPSNGKVSADLFIKSLFNIGYTFFALLFGYGLAEFFHYFDYALHINSWNLLLIFMFLIGLDLAHSPLDRSWLNWNIILVPIGCIIGSISGALFTALIIEDISLQNLIMLSQGYGFYSMTGIVVTELKNAELGSMALMNDLFREIIAILCMYLIGWRHPRAAISCAGATAMDATLPMVKQACGNNFIPHAIVSGFILSILAPIAVSILAVL